MKRNMTLIGILAVLMAMGLGWFAGADQGQQADLEAYVAAHPNSKLLLIGDSWMHGDSYPGKNMNPSTGKPSNWASMFADSSACQGNEFGQQLARRLNTVRWASLGVGSMELMLDDDAGVIQRAQQDSSIWGIMRPYYADLYDPDIVVMPGGGGYNDIVGGSDYTELRAETIETAKKALKTFDDADWIVWIGPRPIGIYHYTRLSGGTDASRQILAAAEYVMWQKFSTFIADTLRTELAEDGINVSRFVTFDSRPGSVIAEADTAGAFNDADKFETTTQAQYDVVKAIRWSPLSWYQSDYVHLNDRGNKEYADAIAEDLFGVTISDTYTQGAGRTIYMSYERGHNHLNRMRCESTGYPLKTLQAAVNQAHPGDIIKVIGTGNQSSVAYESSGGAKRSALQYEVVIKKKGLTIEIDDGAYFAGVYDGNTTLPSGTYTSGVGVSLIHPYSCTAGTISDSLSHDGSAEFITANPAVDLDLTISGGVLQGYQYPIRYYNYTNMAFEDLIMVGGAADNGIYPENYGQIMRLDLTNVTCYYDSSYTTPADNTLGAAIDLSVTGVTTSASIYYTGTWRGCHFIGSEDGTTNMSALGALTGLKFIECTWTDTETPTNAGVVFTAADMTSYFTTYFINCLFDFSDAGNIYAIALGETFTASDTLFVINTRAKLIAAGGTAYIVENAAAPDAAFVTYIAGSTFVKVNYPSGRTDFTPGSPTAPDGGTKNYTVTASTYISTTGDTLIYGGVTSFLNYDLSDDFGIEHGPNHASIGPTQYTHPPTITLSGSSGSSIPGYANKSFDQIVDLYCTRNLITDCNPLDPNTYIPVTPPNSGDPAGLAQRDLVIESWSRWYDATGQYVGPPTAGDRGDIILKFN